MSDPKKPIVDTCPVGLRGFEKLSNEGRELGLYHTARHHEVRLIALEARERISTGRHTDNAALEAECDRLRDELAESTRSMMLATTRYVRAEATITRLTAPMSGHDAFWWANSGGTLQQRYDAWVARRLKAPQGGAPKPLPHAQDAIDRACERMEAEPPQGEPVKPALCICRYNDVGTERETNPECAYYEAHKAESGIRNVAAVLRPGASLAPPDVEPVAAPVVEPPHICKAPTWCGTTAMKIGPGLDAKMGLDYVRGWMTEIYCTVGCRDKALPKLRGLPADFNGTWTPDTGRALAAEAECVSLRERLAADCPRCGHPSCTCGSGAHPRKCAKHPGTYDAHVKELNREAAVEEELTQLRERLAVAEARVSK